MHINTPVPKYMCYKCKEISAPLIKSTLHNKKEKKGLLWSVTSMKSVKSILAFKKKKPQTYGFDFLVIKGCENII